MHAVCTRLVTWLRKRAWPFAAAALATLLGVVLLRRLRRPVDDRSPQQRRDAERDDEIVRSAIEENRAVGELERAKAAQSGARAEIAGDVADDATRRAASMSAPARRKAVDAALERIRRRRNSGVLVLLISLAASTAHAGEPMAHPTTSVPGWWMDANEHLELDSIVLELDARQAQVLELKAQATALNRASYRERSATELCSAIASSTRNRLRESDARNAELAALYRDPRLWGPLGLVAGIGLSALTAWAVR